MSRFYIKNNRVIDHPSEINKKEELNNYAIQVACHNKGDKYQGTLIKRQTEREEEKQSENVGGVRKEEGGGRKEEGGGRKEEGGGRKEEGGTKKEEGGGRKEEGVVKKEEGGRREERGKREEEEWKEDKKIDNQENQMSDGNEGKTLNRNEMN